MTTMPSFIGLILCILGHVGQPLGVGLVYFYLWPLSLICFWVAMLSKIGLRAVDVGCPILSMHSIRETAGSQDIQHAIDLFGAFFTGFAQLDAKLVLD